VEYLHSLIRDGEVSERQAEMMLDVLQADDWEWSALVDVLLLPEYDHADVSELDEEQKLLREAGWCECAGCMQAQLTSMWDAGPGGS
jgi:hypothetical protein